MSWYNFFIKKEEEKRSQEPAQVKHEDDSCGNFCNDTLTFASIINGKFSTNTLSSVYAACELLANSLASMQLNVVKVDNFGHHDILHHHPLQRVFHDRGEQTISMFQTMKLAITDTLKKGNGYIYILRASTGDVIGLRWLDASTVTIMYNEQKDELYYLCSHIKGKILPKDIIHFVKNTKGTSGVDGVSVLSYARDVITLAQCAESQAKSFFESGCNVSGILSAGPGTNLTNLQRQQLSNSWSIRGSKSSIQVLPANVQYVPIGTDAAKALLLESRSYEVQEMARFLNIPLQLLQAGDKLAYSDLQTINLIYLTHTLLPWIKMIEAEMSKKLFWGTNEDDLRVDMDENEYCMRCDKSTQSSTLSTLVSSGIMTVNEARSELSLPRIEDPQADKLHIAYSDITQNSFDSSEEPNEEPKDDEQAEKVEAPEEKPEAPEEKDKENKKESPKQTKSRSKRKDK